MEPSGPGADMRVLGRRVSCAEVEDGDFIGLVGLVGRGVDQRSVVIVGRGRYGGML